MQVEPSFSSRNNQTLPPLPHQSARPVRRHFWLQSLLLLGFIICLLVSALALGALWWLYDAPALANENSPTLAVERIVPQLALMQLAGDPTDALAYQALNASELETSRSLLLHLDAFSPTRLALTLQLAQRYAQAQQPVVAAALYQQARAIAVLDLSLSPLERSEALLRSATGLLHLDRAPAALEVARQIELIGQQTPDLLPAQRQQLFDDLHTIAPQLNDTDFTQTLAELVRNPYLTPSTALVTGRWPALDEDPEPDATLLALTAERQRLARQLAERLSQVQLVEARAEHFALAQILRSEDQQRTLYFNQISASQNLTFSLQFLSLQQQRDWLILKLSVAQQLYGLSLVPEWEKDQVAITQELATTTANLHQALLTLAQSQPTLKEQLTQRFFAITWLASQLELGFYPADHAAEIGEQLRIVQNELRQQGIQLALPVAYQEDGTPPGFQIVATGAP
ncbi:MAG: hypothetical protein R3C14_01820 [Caldilineaceae bacterium]